MFCHLLLGHCVVTPLCTEHVPHNKREMDEYYFCTVKLVTVTKQRNYWQRKLDKRILYMQFHTGLGFWKINTYYITPNNTSSQLNYVYINFTNYIVKLVHMAKNKATKTCMDMETKLPVFLRYALDVGVWLTSPSNRFAPKDKLHSMSWQGSGDIFYPFWKSNPRYPAHS